MHAQTALYFVLRLYALFLTADLLSGIIHWWQDRYGDPEWKFFGKVIIPNLIHHKKPRKFLHYSYLKRNGAAIVLSAVFSGLILLIPGVGWENALILFLFGSQTVEIHAMSHRTEKERGKFFTFLQKIRLIQTPEQHLQRHHKPPYTAGYCLMTDALNPILDYFRIWDRLEVFIASVTGILPLELRRHVKAMQQ